jgi:putative transposase
MPSLSVYDQKRSLTEARKHTWLGDGSSVVQQQALFDLDWAFQNWWKNPGHFSRPTWRKAGVHEGFAIRDLSVRHINRRWGEVLVPKFGWVRFRVTRQWVDICAGTSARVTLDRAGRWHVSFTTPQPAFERSPTGAVVGLDMGIAATVTTSDGEHLKMPELLSPGEAQRRRRLQRRLARQQKGSARRARTRAQIARLSARGTVENPGKNVRQKAGLNRSISSRAWALFRKRLTDKGAAATDPDGSPRPVSVVSVPPAYTSQRCSAFGHTAKENRESQAVFLCRSCGCSANADVNAAINIRAAGLAVSGRGGTPGVAGPVKRQPPCLVAA